MADRSVDRIEVGWPLSGADLDDVEMLEMTRDDEGRLAWHSQAAPASSVELRDWMPKRRRGVVQPEGAPPLPEPGEEFEELLPTRLDMSGAPSVSLADLLPELSWPVDARHSAEDLASRGAAEALPMTVPTDRPADPLVPPPETVGLPLPGPHDPSMRPGLAGAPPPANAPDGASRDITPQVYGDTTARAPAPPAPQARSVPPVVERVALLAAGLLIGIALTLVWGTTHDQRPTPQSTTTAEYRPPAASPRAAPSAPRGQSATVGADATMRAPQPAVLPTGSGGTAPSLEGEATSPAAVPSEAGAVGALSGTEAAERAAIGGRRPEAVDTAPADRTRRRGTPQVPVAGPPTTPGAGHTTAARIAPTRTVVGSPRRAGPKRPPAAPPAAIDVVREYAAAYSRMDARAAQAVWPTADRQALASRFNGLREQRLTLSGCRGQLLDVGAAVACKGILRYRPRVGDHSTRTREGTWRFELAPDGDTWRIGLVTEP